MCRLSTCSSSARGRLPLTSRPTSTRSSSAWMSRSPSVRCTGNGGTTGIRKRATADGRRHTDLAEALSVGGLPLSTLSFSLSRLSLPVRNDRESAGREHPDATRASTYSPAAARTRATTADRMRSDRRGHAAITVSKSVRLTAEFVLKTPSGTPRQSALFRASSPQPPLIAAAWDSCGDRVDVGSIPTASTTRMAQPSAPPAADPQCSLKTLVKRAQLRLPPRIQTSRRAALGPLPSSDIDNTLSDARLCETFE